MAYDIRKINGMAHDWNYTCSEQRKQLMKTFAEMQIESDIPINKTLDAFLPMIKYASYLREKNDIFMTDDSLMELSEKRESIEYQTYNTRYKIKNAKEDDLVINGYGHIIIHNINHIKTNVITVSGNNTIIPNYCLCLNGICKADDDDIRVSYDENDLSVLELIKTSSKNNFWISIVSTLENLFFIIVGLVNQLLYQIKNLTEMREKEIENLQYDSLDDDDDIRVKIKTHTEELRHTRNNLIKILKWRYMMQSFVTNIETTEIITLKAGVPSLYEDICLIWQPLHPFRNSLQSYDTKSVIKECVNDKEINIDSRLVIPELMKMIEYYTQNKEIDDATKDRYEDIRQNLRVSEIIHLPVD